MDLNYVQYMHVLHAHERRWHDNAYSRYNSAEYRPGMGVNEFLKASLLGLPTTHYRCKYLILNDNGSVIGGVELRKRSTGMDWESYRMCMRKTSSTCSANTFIDLCRKLVQLRGYKIRSAAVAGCTGSDTRDTYPCDLNNGETINRLIYHIN